MRGLNNDDAIALYQDLSLTQFFMVPFCEKSLISQEGKSIPFLQATPSAPSQNL